MPPTGYTPLNLKMPLSCYVALPQQPNVILPAPYFIAV